LEYEKTYGKYNTIYSPLNFQLAKLGGGLLYRNRPIKKRLGITETKQNKRKQNK